MSIDRTTLGDPLDWTDENLIGLSANTPADIKAADALWHRDAPAVAKDLIDAEPDGSG